MTSSRAQPARRSSLLREAEKQYRVLPYKRKRCNPFDLIGCRLQDSNPPPDAYKALGKIACATRIGAGFDRLVKIEPMVFADFCVLAIAHCVDIAQNVVVTFGEVRASQLRARCPLTKLSDGALTENAYTVPTRIPESKKPSHED
ncbi:hypothetical protein [Paraburkholderia sediminicola]|uniref:hypothetical protein n=1 Tax=Paraburkholderia sediminicola TaxID=458836 RepID=UPI0038B81450